MSNTGGTGLQPCSTVCHEKSDSLQRGLSDDCLYEPGRPRRCSRFTCASSIHSPRAAEHRRYPPAGRQLRQCPAPAGTVIHRAITVDTDDRAGRRRWSCSMVTRVDWASTPDLAHVDADQASRSVDRTSCSIGSRDRDSASSKPRVSTTRCHQDGRAVGTFTLRSAESRQRVGTLPIVRTYDRGHLSTPERIDMPIGARNSRALLRIRACTTVDGRTEAHRTSDQVKGSRGGAADAASS